MRSIFTKTLMGLGIGALASIVMPSDAKAYGNDYCREYTRTVYIGSRMEEAYGTACLQPDGSWMIVGEGLDNTISNNATNVNYVIRDNNRYVTPQRVVYYANPRVIYRQQPSYVWSHNGHYKSGHYVSYKKNKHWDRHDHRYQKHGHGHHDHR